MIDASNRAGKSPVVTVFKSRRRKNSLGQGLPSPGPRFGPPGAPPGYYPEQHHPPPIPTTTLTEECHSQHILDQEAIYKPVIPQWVELALSLLCRPWQEDHILCTLKCQLMPTDPQCLQRQFTKPSQCTSLDILMLWWCPRRGIPTHIPITPVTRAIQDSSYLPLKLHPLNFIWKCFVDVAACDGHALELKVERRNERRWLINYCFVLFRFSFNSALTSIFRQ